MTNRDNVHFLWQPPPSTSLHLLFSNVQMALLYMWFQTLQLSLSCKWDKRHRYTSANRRLRAPTALSFCLDGFVTAVDEFMLEKGVKALLPSIYIYIFLLLLLFLMQNGIQMKHTPRKSFFICSSKLKLLAGILRGCPLTETVGQMLDTSFSKCANQKSAASS